MQFRARVVDGQQRLRTVELEALDADDARRQLAAQELRALSLSGVRSFGRRSSGGTRFPLTLFAQELLALLEAGLSVIEAVEALIEKDTASTTRLVLTRLLADLRDGQRLSAALTRQPGSFAPLFVGMVQSAEGTSNLHEALSRYIDYRLRVEAVRSRIISAAIYPVILMVVGGAVSLFLLGYVVPRFASVYQDGGRTLPWASQLLLGWGQLLSQHGWAVAAVFGALALLLAGTLRGARAAGAWRALLVRWPWFGERVRLIELSRLYLTLGLLLEGGLPILQVLTLAESVGSAATQRSLRRVRAVIAEGVPLSEALEREALATPIATRLLRVGEASGQLGTMLRRTALFYEGETSRWIERFTKAFEPALMAAIGLVIGLIVLLLYMPIFDLAGTLQ
ncbi:type II secretion system F family protein [Methylibium rhizosphaerae]|uniref:type II secretion system F family protein n=1 Tax=Methylibium rhizosphaerae TaxID=2570323 RepID=UPI0011290647|nr:type II secretion system F family protein [Methylibium rhizosphaerae]